MGKTFKLGFMALLAGCAAVSSAHAAQKPVCEFGEAKLLRPIMATHTIPPYPEMSVMTGEQGVTLMTVTIGVDGTPTDVQVEKTSGSIRLDEAAREHVMQKWRWAPLDAACASFRTRVSVAWDLRDAPQAPPGFIIVRMKPEDFPPGALARREKGAVGLVVALRPGGEIANWKVTQSSGFPDLDSRSLDYVKARHWTPGQMDGKPVFTILQVGLFWGIDNLPAETPR